MIKQLQELEDEFQNFNRIRDINTVAGKLLDIAGEIVGEDRNNRTDEEYRIAIKFRILLNNSNGEPETVIQALRIFTNATDIQYQEVWPAKVRLTFTSVTIPPTNIRELIEQIAPAGVQIFLNWVPEGPYFSVDGEGGLLPEPGTAGFGEEGLGNESYGGNLVEEL
jgi:hypothetical protein